MDMEFSAVQHYRDGSRSKPHYACDLFIRFAFIETERGCNCFLCGKLGDDARQLGLCVVLNVELFRVGTRIDDFLITLRFLQRNELRGSSSSQRDTFVCCDPVNPGSQALLLPKAVKTMVDTKKNVLGYFLGQGHIAKKPEGLLQNRLMVLFDDLVECGVFAGHLGCFDCETDPPPPILIVARYSDYITHEKKISCVLLSDLNFFDNFVELAVLGSARYEAK